MPTIQAYRSDLRQLVALANTDLQVLWRQVTDAEIARDLLAEILPQLVNVYGQAATALAADWYDDARAEAKVSGRFRAVAAELPGEGRTEALAGWAVDPLFQENPDFDSAVNKAQGGLQRIIANAGRYTISASSIADPGAVGWQRTGEGDCAFCEMLIARGAVYTEASADFASHDHCNCAAEPAWDGQPRPVKPYTPSARDITPADRERVREYLRTH